MRTNGHVWRAALATGCLATLAGIHQIARSDEVKDTFDALYGQEMAKVRPTPDRKDDVALARKMLKDAANLGGQEALAEMICQAAFDLSSSAPGEEALAAEALQLLAQKVPAHKEAALEKLATVQEKLFARTKEFEKLQAGQALMETHLALAELAAGKEDFPRARDWYRKAADVGKQIDPDKSKEISQKLTDLAARKQLVDDKKLLTERVEAQPADKVSRVRLIELLVMEYDNPVEAAKLINKDCDAAAQTKLRVKGDKVDQAVWVDRVRLAGSQTEQPDWAACLDLGEWLRELASKSSSQGKGPLLKRAKKYYHDCLAKHTEEDLFLTRAKLGLQKVEEALSESPTSREGWLDLLKLVDLDRDVVWEKCTANEGAVTLGDHARIMLPAVVEGNYDLRVTFTLPKGQGTAVRIDLPVGDHAVTLHIDLKTIRLGIHPEVTNRVPSAEAKLSLALAKKYVADVRVTSASNTCQIQVAVDGKPALAWSGPLLALNWTLPVPDFRCVGVINSYDPVTIHSCQIRMSSGKVTPIRQNVGDKVVVKVPGKALPKDQWFDLLPPVVPELDDILAADAPFWRIAKSELVGDVHTNQDQPLLFPVVPHGEYKLQLSLTRHGRADMGPFILLPVGENGVQLRFMGEGKKECLTLDAVRKPWEIHTDSQVGPIAKDKKYMLEVSVTLQGKDAQIKAELDGREVLSGKGPIDALDPQPFPPCIWDTHRPGIRNFGFDVTVHTAKFMPLTDKAVRIR